MAAQEINESKSKRTEQIHFTLKVSATDLPLTDGNFKIKLTMDFGPEFTQELTSEEGISPNFNATRVRTILNFVSDKVIRKVVEFIYLKEVYIKDGKPYNLIDNEMVDETDKEAIKTIPRIYSDRSKFRQENKDKDLSEKEGIGEEEITISRIVNNLIDKDGRKVPIEEKSVANIKFEHLSPGVLSVNVQKIINGDMPPPR